MLEPTTVFVADSFLLELVFCFATTDGFICYHRRHGLLPPYAAAGRRQCFFLLQPCHFFAATGSHRRYNWLTFLLQWCRRAFNLLEALPFFATTGRSFCCYRHPDGEYSFLRAHRRRCCDLQPPHTGAASAVIGAAPIITGSCNYGDTLLHARSRPRNTGNDGGEGR